MATTKKSKPMEINGIASTPVRNGSPLVRRSIAITPISNVIDSSPAIQDVRQERLSSINKSTTRNKDGHTTTLRLEKTNTLSCHREGFMSYLKLFQTNKINKQNIWDVNLIHDFYCLVDMRDETVVGDLHLASVALDASTKIYSMRVDDVHQDVVRLASGLIRSDKKGSTRKDTDCDECNIDVEVDGNGDVQKKKKTLKPRKRKPRSHIVNDVSQINGEVEVNSELDRLFTCRAAMLGDAMSTDKMYSLTLNTYKETYITDLRSRKLINIAKRDEPITNAEKEYPKGELVKWAGSEINPSLSNFKFLDWDSDTICDNEEVGLNSSQLEIAFDINAHVEQIPPEFSNDENMIIDNDENFQNYSDGDKENTPFSEVGSNGINGIRLQKNKVQYSYDPRIKRLISKLYAGPLHLRFPFQQKKVNVKTLYTDESERSRITSTESGDGRVRNAKKTIPHQNFRESGDLNDGLFKSTHTNKLKGSVMLNWNQSKNLLPDNLELIFGEQNKCFLRVTYDFNTNTREDMANATSVDHAVPEYDYQNVNDSNFCAIVDNAELYSDDENPGSSAIDDGNILTQELVEAPELVNKVKINYDTKVRTVDMKMVKKYTWKIIENNLITPAPGVEKKPCIMFSSVFAELHRILPLSETENLTVGIASLSVMHITNDNNLLLTQDDRKDFIISLPPQ